MPKVEASLVNELFSNMKYMLEGINETIKSGDDGFQYSVDSLIEDMEKAMNSFTILNLTAVTKVEKTKLSYLKFKDDFIKRKESEDNIQTNSSENLKLYKAELYFHIKKQLRSQGQNLIEVSSDELFNFIELTTIIGSKFEKFANAKEWCCSTNYVIMDVVHEIVDQRKKAPQQRIFDSL